jgi:hypothetical protein
MNDFTWMLVALASIIIIGNALVWAHDTLAQFINKEK